MKILSILFEKIYWMILMGIPFVPEFILVKYHSALACNIDGICFRYGHPVLNSEGLKIVNFSIALLVPLSIWQLVGKHIFSRSFRRDEIIKLRTSRTAVLLKGIFWMAVAAIPFLFWYLFGTIQAPIDCHGFGGCIKYYLPLDTVDKVAVLIVFFLLWPISFSNIFKK